MPTNLQRADQIQPFEFPPTESSTNTPQVLKICSASVRATDPGSPDQLFHRPALAPYKGAIRDADSLLIKGFNVPQSHTRDLRNKAATKNNDPNFVG
ncbi:hypothetical protein EST38_g10021 [Candolleomyces aberdarensis]|uniref:Uncharacterized protein n=1 Tax=Candolleomyces aberdarensis TaxID=2316362 RepID=A0A4Q2DA71_9AGAR|nr:hypothetical protein EST38_g10021 [Candolleomyces aberdarensis]